VIPVAAFYHVWAPGRWQEPLTEFLGALSDSSFDGPLHVGIVGNFAERAAVQVFLDRDCEFIPSRNGWEQITLDAVRDYAQQTSGAVLYAHTKGAYNPSKRQEEIRTVLHDQVVRQWRQNVVQLADHDVVGYGWTKGYQAFFQGNFWVANCSYLRSLPVCSRVSRFRAEGWLGLGDPQVYDLSPEKIVYEPLRWEPVKNSDVCWS
jgi:hypothetical protein